VGFKLATVEMKALVACFLKNLEIKGTRYYAHALLHYEPSQYFVALVADRLILEHYEHAICAT